MLDIMKLNNIDMGPEDPIIEVCFTSAEVASEDIAEDGFTTIIDDHEVDVSAYNLKYVPAKLFEGAKEGDEIEYTVMARAFVKRPEGENIGKTFEEINVILNMTLVCRQKGYKYQQCGRFEEVFKNITTVTKKEPDEKEVDEKSSGIRTTEDNKNKKEKRKTSMINAIREKWNGLPGGVKTGVKIVGGVVTVAAVGYAGKVAYDKYRAKDSETVAPTDKITIEESNDLIIIDNSERAVISLD